MLPSYRNTAVSFIRILLQESVLHRRPYRLPTDTVHSCNCGHSVEDLEHFFLHCNQYDKARQKLNSAVTDVWNDSEQAEKLVITVPLLLAPSANSDLSRSECRTVLQSTFKFIEQSRCIL